LRDLRNKTRELIKRIASGETLLLTDGAPPAMLSPIPTSSRPRTMPAATFKAHLVAERADPAMARDLAALLGDETTDDIEMV